MLLFSWTTFNAILAKTRSLHWSQVLMNSYNMAFFSEVWVNVAVAVACLQYATYNTINVPKFTVSDVISVFCLIACLLQVCTRFSKNDWTIVTDSVSFYKFVSICEKIVSILAICCHYVG